MRSIVIASIFAAGSALCLGACSKHDGASTTTTTTAATTTTATASTSAASAMPKPGLWEMTVSGGAMPAPMKTKVCLGAPPPGANPFTPPPQPGQACAKNSVVKTATGYSVDTECTVNGMTMSTKGDVTGDFSSDYKTVMTTKMTGANVPPMMQTARTSTAEAKYLGACPADMKPGMVSQSG